MGQTCSVVQDRDGFGFFIVLQTFVDLKKKDSIATSARKT